MLEFNNNHIITGEIKQLLKEFNLPLAKVWKPGVQIISGCFYIKDNNLYCGTALLELQLIGPYIYGQEILNLTKNLIIDSLLYDSYTHKYLGDYLRFYRDIKHIDLMSMYNCFSNELCKKLEIYKSGSYDFDTANDQFKIYMVPVKWFQNYTIAIECDTQIELIAGIYDNERLIAPYADPEDYKLYDATYLKLSGTRFSSPVLYTKINAADLDKRLYSQEANLKLFIKVPAMSKSSVVVLEGDYTKHNQLYFSEDSGLATLKPAKEVCNFEVGSSLPVNDPIIVYDGANRERTYLSKLQLLDFNSTINYPFADRLIEYLFGHVITSDDEVVKNIERLQKRLVQRYNLYLFDKVGNYILSDGTTISVSAFNHLSPTDPRKEMRIHKSIGTQSIINNPSMWSTKLRNVCYDVVLNSSISKSSDTNKFDLIGFVDKDTEREIGEYAEVTK